MSGLSSRQKACCISSCEARNAYSSGVERNGKFCNQAANAYKKLMWHLIYVGMRAKNGKILCWLATVSGIDTGHGASFSGSVSGRLTAHRMDECGQQSRSRDG